MASEPQDAPFSTSQASHADLDSESLSPLEQEVLDEYARLLGNLNTVRPLALQSDKRRRDSIANFERD
jgi:DASH complex subunit DAD3